MAKTITTRFDVAEHLRTPEEMAAYLETCFEEAHGDATFIAKALGDIARAKGMSQVARDAGLSRESLYKALSGERSPHIRNDSKGNGGSRLKITYGSSSIKWLKKPNINSFEKDACYAAAPHAPLKLGVVAPRKARRIFQSESPCREGISNDFL